LDKLLEVACFDLRSAVIAEEAGADRLELCTDYGIGGITPPDSAILSARQKIKIPLFVLIRPRGGDFLFNETEIARMERDIVFCRENGVDGIVTGVLNMRNQPDASVLEKFTGLSSPMPVTFHRAIDLCHEKDPAVEILINCGVQRVLTSGGPGDAAENVDEIKRLNHKFGSRIKIMPGGKVRSDNIIRLIQTGCTEFHSSAITGLDQLADRDEIKRIKKLLEKGASP
jgi:copper homeostasis protein